MTIVTAADSCKSLAKVLSKVAVTIWVQVLAIYGSRVHTPGKKCDSVACSTSTWLSTSAVGSKVIAVIDVQVIAAIGRELIDAIYSSQVVAAHQ